MKMSEVLLSEKPAYEMKTGTAEEYARYYHNNESGYGGAVLRYASAWAKTVEDGGDFSPDAFEKASYIADDEGITGFMYGCAVSELAYYWSHGEELRRWHNKETQIGTEGDQANETGGVLNPALLNVKLPS